MKRFVQREQDAHKQEVVLINKKHEQKLSQKYEESLKESGLRIVEAEEAVKEVDAQHKKELKSLKREHQKQVDELAKSHASEVEQLQTLHKEQIALVTAGFKREIDELKSETQSVQFKLVEMSAHSKSDQQELQRLIKEN